VLERGASIHRVCARDEIAVLELAGERGQPRGVRPTARVGHRDLVVACSDDSPVAPRRDACARSIEHPHRQATLAPVVDELRAAVAGSAVDDHDLLRRTLLLGQRRQQFRETGPIVQHGNHDRDRRRHESTR